MPTGSNSAINDVPVAACCEKDIRNTNSGTMIMPPPIPNRPEEMPAVEPMSMYAKISIIGKVGCRGKI